MLGRNLASGLGGVLSAEHLECHEYGAVTSAVERADRERRKLGREVERRGARGAEW
jgi:hypothetical protein